MLLCRSCLQYTCTAECELYSFKMLKVKSFYRINNYVLEFGENTFSFDGVILFCKICKIKVNSNKRFTVIQHLKTKKHILTTLRKNENKSTKQSTTNIHAQRVFFAKDLCKLYPFSFYMS